MDNRPSLELLESTHTFPGPYRMKAIGAAENDFTGRVLAAVLLELAAESDLEHTERATPGGRHVALTLNLTVQNAEQVRAIYARVQEVEGLTMLF